MRWPKKNSTHCPGWVDHYSYQLYESRHSDWERRGKPRQIPYLRLSGDWLEAAGFEVGCKVSIQVTRRRLVMHVVED
ncbi:type I toxin-antitoxin system SymE family toxin [Pseudomonas aeruginosa]|nr:type I toxin-antitoxin system SymE family toxin [Pseudomonas aeruginosa]